MGAVLSFIAPETCGAGIKVLEDNQGTKTLIENPLSSASGNHIDVRFHFIRDLFKARKITVEHLASADQHADILTKALSRANFRYHRKYPTLLKEQLDFTVDEGKGRLNPCRDRNQGKHRRGKVKKFCVDFFLCDPGWCVYESDVRNKWDGSTHTHC